MSDTKKERWTEIDVDNLPAGELESFDRKSGGLLGERDNFDNKMAKALSAFANTGGGHIILGVRNDGSFDGVEPMTGNQPTREWLEQILPNLVEHPLRDFRVHEVEPGTSTKIPAGKVLIVIDVGDSAFAPHQSVRDHIYYHRVGSHSTPARHFYLELLRNRLVHPMLVGELFGIDLRSASVNDSGILIRMSPSFRITNKGRVAAFAWEILPLEISGKINEREADYYWEGSGGHTMKNPLLPYVTYTVENAWFDIYLQLRPESLSKRHLIVEINTMLPVDCKLSFNVVSETSIGEIHNKVLADMINIEAFVDSILARI